MERGADIQAHREAMELRHHDVLETRALELLRGSEHLGPDESRDIVDDHPRAGLLTDVSSHAVRSRLQRDHVDALGGAVGDRGSLAGLEVQAGEASREVENAVDVEPDHAGKRPRRAGKALKPDIDGRTSRALCCLGRSDSTQ